MQRLVSDAQRNVRLYSTFKDRKSPLNGSRPSVPHGTNFYELKKNRYLAFCSAFPFLRKSQTFRQRLIFSGNVIKILSHCNFFSTHMYCIIYFIPQREFSYFDVKDACK